MSPDYSKSPHDPDDYMLGFAPIDKEHRYLITLADRAVVAVGDRNRAEALSLLNRFVAACQFHFTSEERIMRQIGFEGIDRHVVYHQKLLDMAHALLDECEDAVEMKVVGEKLDALIRCLLDDVIRGDREFLPLLQNSQSK